MRSHRRGDVDQKLDELSKDMAKVLRYHLPDLGIRVDRDNFVLVQELQQKGTGSIKRATLNDIVYVAKTSKSSTGLRFELRGGLGHEMVRARYVPDPRPRNGGYPHQERHGGHRRNKQREQPRSAPQGPDDANQNADLPHDAAPVRSAAASKSPAAPEVGSPGNHQVFQIGAPDSPRDIEEEYEGTNWNNVSTPGTSSTGNVALDTAAGSFAGTSATATGGTENTNPSQPAGPLDIQDALSKMTDDRSLNNKRRNRIADSCPRQPTSGTQGDSAPQTGNGSSSSSSRPSQPPKAPDTCPPPRGPPKAYVPPGGLASRAAKPKPKPPVLLTPEKSPVPCQHREDPSHDSATSTVPAESLVPAVAHVAASESNTSSPPMEVWVKYRDENGRIWYWHEPTKGCFFQDNAAEHGWQQYRGLDGKFWWWNDASRRSFFEPEP